MNKDVMIPTVASQIGMAIARRMGEIAMLVNAAGVSPSQASIETILHVDLYGTAELLMRPMGAFVTGADFLVDGGATASFFTDHSTPIPNSSLLIPKYEQTLYNLPHGGINRRSYRLLDG